MLKTPVRLDTPLSHAVPARRQWPLVAVWILAVGLVGTLFWVVPRASVADRLSTEASSLTPQVSNARALVSAQTDQLVTITADLDAATGTRDGLLARRSKNEKRIRALNKKIDDLEAAAANASAPAGSSGQSYPMSAPPPPPPPQMVCTPGPDGVNVCYFP